MPAARFFWKFQVQLGAPSNNGLDLWVDLIGIPWRRLCVVALRKPKGVPMAGPRSCAQDAKVQTADELSYHGASGRYYSIVKAGQRKY